MGQIKLGTVKPASISDRYVGFWPCLQLVVTSNAASPMVDQSGKGNNGIIAGTAGVYTAMWAAPTYFQANATFGDVISIPKALLQAMIWNATRKDSLVWSARVYRPVLEGGGLMASGTSSTTPGFFLETEAAGTFRVKFYDLTTGLAGATSSVAFAAAAWKTVTVILDGPSNMVYVAVDGAVLYAGAVPNAAGDKTSVAANEDPNFLAITRSSGANPMRGYGFHIAIIPSSAGSIPDPYALARRLHRNPLTPLSAIELP